MQLSVLDQSYSRSANHASQALHETIEMAKWCEQLGYKRFWVSEHHAFSSVAGSAPEVLLAALGAATKEIRLGSGGIMLPHYSAYKVAEVFSLLANLYPGRIDLGVGRAPGADMATAVALATDGRPKFERFPSLVSELDQFLNADVTSPLVSPKPPRDLPIWILGTSPDSAVLAAEQGLPYNLGLFINPQAPAQLIGHYKNAFQAGASKTMSKTTSQTKAEAKAQAIITIGVFCADTYEQADIQRHCFDVNFFRFVTGQRTNDSGRLLSPEEAQEFPMSPHLQSFIVQRNENRAVGTPDQVRKEVLDIAGRYQADEVMAVTNMYDFEDRKRSFELLRTVFDD